MARSSVTLCKINDCPLGGISNSEHSWHGDKLAPVEPVDAVVHPPHYGQVPNIECIDVVQHFNFNRGNAIKYVWRAGAKGNPVEDLLKAIEYCKFEIERIENEKIASDVT